MKKIARGLRYAFTVMNHPIRGFYDIRFEGQGNPVAATLWLVFLIAMFVVHNQYTGYIFHTNNIREFNVLQEIGNALIPVFLWCVANWCITVLMDGKGRFSDIYMATCYAVVPYAAATLLRVILSLFLTQQEQTFLEIISGIGLAFTALLLFTGIMSIHQFTVSKTLFAILLTVLGMAFILILLFIFVSLIGRMISLGSAVGTELSLRT